MRKLFVVLLFVSGALSAGAQTPANEDKKKPKEPAKAEKKQKEDLVNASTIDLKTLLASPQDYSNKTLRVKSATLEQISPMNDGEYSLYLLSFRTKTASVTAESITTGQVSFFLPEDIAQALIAMTDNLPRGYKMVADLWFDLKLVQDIDQKYYGANVRCADFKNAFGRSIHTFGKCP